MKTKLSILGIALALSSTLWANPTVEHAMIKKEIRDDRKEIREDKRETRADRRDLRDDRRDLRKDIRYKKHHR